MDGDLVRCGQSSIVRCDGRECVVADSEVSDRSGVWTCRRIAERGCILEELNVCYRAVGVRCGGAQYERSRREKYCAVRGVGDGDGRSSIRNRTWSRAIVRKPATTGGLPGGDFNINIDIVCNQMDNGGHPDGVRRPRMRELGPRIPICKRQGSIISSTTIRPFGVGGAHEMCKPRF